VRLLDSIQNMREVIGLEVPRPEEAPAYVVAQHFTAWAPGGRYLVYLDPTASRERLRLYDTVEIRQTQYRNIKGELPEVSPDDAVVVFQGSGRLYVMTLDGTALYPLADGSGATWVR
jgi:hypothetical protein